MREKELRLALVCFGGVSLAIYIHGVSKELLKLVRASKALHFDPDPNALCRQKYIYPNDNITDIADTELVYFDILKSFSPDLDLRIIIDTIAGASAGGMNSVFLGRAIAHDLNYDHLRHHWLIEADVSKLTGDKKNAGRFEKLFTKPFINILSKKFLGTNALSSMVMEKLPSLLNIWNLKPPFDGKHLLKLVYGGLQRMGNINNHSLLPHGHQLELFVTLTDFYGYKRTILLNDPPSITELEHRHTLSFTYIKKYSDNNQSIIESDFNEEDLPALSFAARATSCFPGAFPPAQIRETEHFMKEHDKSWLKKEDFISKNFKEYAQAGINPELTSFLDGSILNNKPFEQAIKAIHDRPAFREVERRVIYIDPNPERVKARATGAPPSLLNTMKGAMSDIPMNEPIHDDLQDIHIYNQQVNTIKDVVDSVRPSVEKLVYDVCPKKLKKITSVKDLTAWRSLSSARAVTEAGYSYEAYARLKIRSTVAGLTKIIADICDYPRRSKQRRQIYSIIQCWVLRDTVGSSLLYGDDNNNKTANGLFGWTSAFLKKDPALKNIPYWANFIIDFDIDYQRRRLQFLIQDLNAQYPHQPDHVHELDECKMSLYQILGKIKYFNGTDRIDPENITHIRNIFSDLLSFPFSDDIDCKNNQAQLDIHKDKINRVLEILRPSIGLDNIRQQTDQLISKQLNNSWGSHFKRNLLISYLGFAFWDVITFSIMGAKTLGEFNEILVNRISPNDELTLKPENKMTPLKGTALKSFGAFFSREDRENDYLWGRLNGAERLIDLLYNQALSEGIQDKIDVKAIKKRAFLCILEAEKEHLHTVPELLDEIRALIDKL